MARNHNALSLKIHSDCWRYSVLCEVAETVLDNDWEGMTGERTDWLKAEEIGSPSVQRDCPLPVGEAPAHEAAPTSLPAGARRS